MNRWVVLLLMTLAFLAGSLSFRQGGNSSPPPPSPTPLATPSAEPLAVASPAAGDPVRKPFRDPNFGPAPGAAGSDQPALKTPRLAQASISATVFSSSLDGPSRTQFPAGSGPIFMTVTPLGVPDKVELEASYRNTLKEDEPFSSPVQSSGPPRKRTFRLSPPPQGWLKGPYQVVVKPAGSDQVLTLARLEITPKDAPAPAKHPAPEYIDLVLTPQDEGPRSVFDQKDPQIGLLVYTEGVPESVMVRTVWSAVEVDKLAPGEIVAVSEKAAPGPGKDAFFTFTPKEGDFHPGSYRVDVYFDQQEMGSQAFFIQPSTAAQIPSPTP